MSGSGSLRLADADMRDAPVRVSGIRMLGNARTHASFLENEFAGAAAARSLAALHHSLDVAVGRLHSTGVFDSADVEIDLSNVSSGPGHNNGNIYGTPSAVVNIRVKEKTRPYLQVGVNAGARADGGGAGAQQLSTPDVAGEIQAVVPNLLGFAETYKLSVRTNDRGDKDMQFNVMFPSLTSRRMPVHVGAKTFSEDKHGLSSFKTDFKNFTIGTGSTDGSHRWNFEFAVRDELLHAGTPSSSRPELSSTASGGTPVIVAGSGKLASHDVANSVVPSTKASVSYVFSRDSRNSPSNPTSGAYLEFSSEVAFPPGTVDFLKSSLALQRHFELGPRFPVEAPGQRESVLVPGLSVSFATAIAAVLPIGFEFGTTGKRTPVPLCDRFYSGGNFFLRGFAPYSIGPRSAPYLNENFSGGVAAGDALGGLLKTNALVAVSVPVPISAAARNGARAFAFCSLGAVDSPQSLRNTSLSEIISGSNRVNSNELLHEVARMNRVTVGCGTSLSMGPVRLEATYSVPVRKEAADVMRQFQIGIGISIA